MVDQREESNPQVAPHASEIIHRLQIILEKEYRLREKRALDWFSGLWKKSFLSAGEYLEMEKLKDLIRILTNHKGITESHKFQGLGCSAHE